MRKLDLMLTLIIFLLIGACTGLGAGINTPTPADTPTTAPTDTPTPEPTATQILGSDATPTPDPAVPTATESSLEGLNEAGEAVAAALESRDFAAMRALMGDQFAFATQNMSLIVVQSDEAIETLKLHALADGSQPVVKWGTDVPALLGGVDPLSLWGPVDVVLRAFHVMGLGPQATEEAVLVIGRAPDGRFVWHGILTPQSGGYFQAQ